MSTVGVGVAHSARVIRFWLCSVTAPLTGRDGRGESWQCVARCAVIGFGHQRFSHSENSG